MKKFLCRLSFFAAYAAIIQFILPVAIDPANVFHAEHIRPLITEPNRNYIKMKYILASPDKFTGYLFGSSRVGSIHIENILGEKVYNMTYSMGVPAEHLANIRTMLSHDVKPSVIYVGLDNFSYTEIPETHITQPLRCPYEYLYNNPEHFYSLYLNPYYTLCSLLIMLRRGEIWNKNIAFEAFYSYGWWADYDTKPNYDWSSVKYTYKQSDHTLDHKLIERSLSCIKSIKDLCGDNNINLALFTNPIHCTSYMEAVDRDYLYFIERLAEIADFWNFSGINDITTDGTNYIDKSHYDAYIGDKMLNVICSGEVYPELYAQGFGVKVTRENVKDIINLLKHQAEDFRKTL